MKMRLLIVEDDEALRSSLVRSLDRSYVIDEAGDGREASECLTHKRFDVVLSDIDLPHGSGIDVLRLVRDCDLDVPVILMTGQPSVDTAIEAMDLGAFTYLKKPFERGTLERALGRAGTLGKLARIKREAMSTLGKNGALPGDRAGLSTIFQQALDTLWIAYQPILCRQTQKTIGFEALLRCKAMPTPNAVIEAAERLDRIHDLGRRVRECAAACFKPCNRDMLLFVNLHAVDFSDPELYSSTTHLAKIASSVILEVTERTAINDITDTRRRATELRSLGYRIAVDDLGAGYAGLTTFANLEPEVVKLDMSLVRNIENSPVQFRIVEGITNLCHSLGMKVVAEGIETTRELQTIHELGCDYLQGYLLGAPQPFLLDHVMQQPASI